MDPPRRSRLPAERLVHRGIDLGACYRYTLSRQTRAGGFSFYTHPEWGVDEPNAPDTCAAVEIIAALGEAMPDVSSCIAWLQAQQADSGDFPTWTIGHAVLKALRHLGAKPERDPQPNLLGYANRLRVSAPKAQPGWLLQAARCVELFRILDLELPCAFRETIPGTLTSLRHADGGYGATGGNLPESALALELSLEVDAPVHPELLSFARQCEGPPHGFNIAPHSACSALETQLAGLQILQHFAMRPRRPGEIESYVAACQMATGGFGRAPGATECLDDSLHALQILALLGTHEGPSGSRASTIRKARNP